MNNFGSTEGYTFCGLVYHEYTKFHAASNYILRALVEFSQPSNFVVEIIC
jgi:hypothetical protein